MWFLFASRKDLSFLIYDFGDMVPWLLHLVANYLHSFLIYDFGFKGDIMQVSVLFWIYVLLVLASQVTVWLWGLWLVLSEILIISSLLPCLLISARLCCLFCSSSISFAKKKRMLNWLGFLMVVALCRVLLFSHEIFLGKECTSMTSNMFALPQTPQKKDGTEKEWKVCISLL